MKKCHTLILILGVWALVYAQALTNVRIYPSQSAYYAGTKVKIFWDYPGIVNPPAEKAKITLWKEGGTKRICRIAQDVMMTDGSKGYLWVIPSVCTNPDTGKPESLTEGRLKIRIRWQGHPVWKESRFFKVKKTAPKYEFFFASPSKVLKGRKTMLRWSIPGATNGRLEYDSTKVAISLPSGFIEVVPLKTTVYTLVFLRNGKEQRKSVKVVVKGEIHKAKFHLIYRSLPDLTIERIELGSSMISQILEVYVRNISHPAARISVNSEFFIKAELKSPEIESYRFFKISCRDKGNENCNFLRKLSGSGQAIFKIFPNYFNDYHLTFFSPDSKVKITIDSGNDIKESNENNNAKVYTVKY